MTGTTRQVTPLLIVFLDFTRWSAQVQRVDDMETADTIDAFYRAATKAIRGAGGTPVKFIGDAALAVFPEQSVDAGVRAVIDLKQSMDRFMEDRDWECRLTAKAHFGMVVAGEFGPEGEKRFDVIGRAVNTAAMLKSDGVALSAEAFRKLSPEMRASFKKHTPPITYIRHEDPRPSAARRG